MHRATLVRSSKTVRANTFPVDSSRPSAHTRDNSFRCQPLTTHMSAPPPVSPSRPTPTTTTDTSSARSADARNTHHRENTAARSAVIANATSCAQSLIKIRVENAEAPSAPGQGCSRNVLEGTRSHHSFCSRWRSRSSKARRRAFSSPAPSKPSERRRAQRRFDSAARLERHLRHYYSHPSADRIRRGWIHRKHPKLLARCNQTPPPDTCPRGFESHIKVNSDWEHRGARSARYPSSPVCDRTRSRGHRETHRSHGR